MSSKKRKVDNKPKIDPELDTFDFYQAQRDDLEKRVIKTPIKELTPWTALQATMSYKRYMTDPSTFSKTADYFAPKLVFPANASMSFSMFQEDHCFNAANCMPDVALLAKHMANVAPYAYMRGNGMTSEMLALFSNRLVIFHDAFLFRVGFELPYLQRELYEDILKALHKMWDEKYDEGKEFAHLLERQQYGGYKEDSWRKSKWCENGLEVILPLIPQFDTIYEALGFIHNGSWSNYVTKNLISVAVLKKNWNTIFGQKTEFDAVMLGGEVIDKNIWYDHPAIRFD